MKPYCRQQYFGNLDQTLSLLDVVQGEVDLVEQTVSFFFPYPFQILGTALITEWSTSPPVSELPMNEFWETENAATQDTNAPWIRQMFAVMMYANRDVDNYANSPFLGAITYEEEGAAKYEKYFQSIQNAALKTTYYNQFISNSSLIRRFWANEVGLATPFETQQRLLEFTERLFNTSDRRHWGSPGRYDLYYGEPEEGGQDLLLVSEFEYITT